MMKKLISNYINLSHNFGDNVQDANNGIRNKMLMNKMNFAITLNVKT